MTDEVWRDVPLKEFRDFYEVSSLGRVRRKARLCKSYAFTDSGRHYVILSSPIIKKSKAKKGGRGNLANIHIHRLVALAFCDGVDPKKHVNHINGKKTDNRAENLQWVTPRENTDHAMKHGLYRSPANKKVDTDQVIKMHKEGMSQRAIAAHFGCTKSSVRNTINRYLHGIPWASKSPKKKKRASARPRWCS